MACQILQNKATLLSLHSRPVLALACLSFPTAVYFIPQEAGTPARSDGLDMILALLSFLHVPER